jgi:DNA-binding SARP family transcriptional activator/tetratricopeptide (TPR) repeat protein
MLILLHRQIRSNPPLQIRLLGTPQVTFLGQKVSLSRRQGRALLYYLACAGRPVSRDQLTFLLFPDDPDSSARRKLTRILSHLQSQFPGIQPFCADNSSVLINPEKLWTDVAELDSLGENNLPYYQEQAVEIYRGPFLEGFSLPYSQEYDRWLTEQRQLYENRYLFLLEQLVHQSIESGDHQKGIQYALKYLEVDELGEHIHRSLIELYHTAGNRSAAIRQYESCVIILERELGVEPLPETHEVYKTAAKGILQPKSINPIPQWSVIPSLTVPMVGREKAWQELQTAYTRFQTGGFILIKGEAGIGKSRLVQEFASRGSRLVLTGNCYFSTQSLPYHPIIQALRQAISRPDLWEPIRPIWLAEAALLLPELEDIFPGLPSPIQVEPGQAQARLYEGLTQCFLGLASKSGLLLCLDDLHWMDEATKGWLTVISRRLPGSGLCLLGSYRTEEASAVADVKEVYSRQRLLVEVALSGINFNSIQQVLSNLPSPPSDPLLVAQKLSSATGGNPFFVLETIRTLIESGLLDSPPAELPLAETIQEAAQLRLAHLSPIARQIVEAASVLLPELEFSLLQKTSGRTDLEMAEGLEELVQRQLLVDEDRYNFKHDLLAQAAYQNITAGRLRLLHRRAAESYKQVYQGQHEKVIVQIAKHYDSAGCAEEAVGYYQHAALVAKGRYAHDEAISCINRAISLLYLLELSEEKLCNLYEDLGDSLWAKGDYESAREAFTLCIEHITSQSPIEQVRIMYKICCTFTAQRRIDEFDRAYKNAMERLNGRTGREVEWQSVWLDLQLARLETLYFKAETGQLDGLIQQISPALEKAGSARQKVKFLQGQSFLYCRQERYLLSDRTCKVVEEALKAAHEYGDRVEIINGTFGYGFSLLMSGELEKAADVLTECFRMAEETGMALTQCQCLTYLAHLSRLRFDVEATRKFALKSLELAQKLDVPVYVAAAKAQLAWIDWQDQKFLDAEQKAHDSLSIWGGFPHPFKWYANWVLFAIALKKEQISEAVEAAKNLLHPNQQRLPDDINADLQSGIDKWDSGNILSAQKFLNRSVEIGKVQGYL